MDTNHDFNRKNIGTVLTGVALAVSFILATVILITALVGKSGSKQTLATLEESLAAQAVQSDALDEDAILQIQVDTVNEEVSTFTQADTFVDGTEEERLLQAQQLLEELEAKGLVTDVKYDSDSEQYCFTYADGSWGSIGVGQEDPYTNITVITQGTADSLTEIQHSILPETECDLSAVNCFENEAKRRDFYTEKFGEWSDKFDFSIRYDVDVTVDELQHLGNSDFILFSAHGGTYSGLPGLLTRDTVTSEKSERYRTLLRSNCLLTRNGSAYVVLPGFFSSVYGPSGLDGSVFLSESCKFFGGNGNINNELADDILSCSAEAVIGFHNSVYMNYSRDLLTYVVEKMVAGATVSDALSRAKDKYGENDGNSPAAYPILRGNENYTLKSKSTPTSTATPTPTATPAPAATSAPAVVVPSSGDGVLSINCAGVSLTFGEDYDSVKSKMDARCDQYFYLDSTEEASWDYKKLIYTYDNSDCGFTDITLYFFCWGEREEYYVLTDVRMNDYDNVRTDCSVAGVYLGMSQSDAAGRMSLYETDSHWTCYNLYAVNYGVSGGIVIDREISLQDALSGNYPKFVIARTGESNEQEQGHVGTLEVILCDYAEDHDLYLDYLDSVEEHTESYSPGEVSTESYSPEETYSLSIGEIVTFGTYMHSSSGSIDELDWIVLDRDGDYYLLTTLYGIDAMNFDGSTYANSAVRSFLNNDFYYTAFTSSERSLIRTTHVSAESNPKYPNRDAGSSTDDKVFILSISEAEKYFPTDEDRQCYPTNYAISQGARTSSDCGTCYYWLTNPGSESKRHAVVDGTGIIWHKGQQSLEWGKRGCVRPCIWIKIG